MIESAWPFACIKHANLAPIYRDAFLVCACTQYSKLLAIYAHAAILIHIIDLFTYNGLAYVALVISIKTLAKMPCIFV